MSIPKLISIFIFACCLASSTMAQTDSTYLAIKGISSKYISSTEHKIEKYSSRLTSKTEKTLVRLSRWENKIKGLLEKASPETAARLFANPDLTFAGLLQKLRRGEAIEENYKGQYDEYRDKLGVSLKYIETERAKVDSNIIKPLKAVSQKMDSLNMEVANSEATDKFIRERKKQLVVQAVQYIRNSKYLQKISKESYYYTQTLQNYKEIFSDPQKAEKTAKVILDKIPAFKKFFEQNSVLASMFGSPSSYGTPQALAGLQTRAGVNAMISGQLASGGPNAMDQFKQSMQQAQAELLALKDKVLKSGGTSGNANIPDFKPNEQRSKTFMQRMVFGANLQFGKSDRRFPATADIALTAGFKFNDKSLFGIGITYKLGMGSIQRLSLSHEGIGVRSFLDWKLKKQLFVTGGYELNHLSSFKKFADLQAQDSWQRAALIGVTKKMAMKAKLVKNTQVQLLYDVLYSTHLPITQPFVFRVGYSF